VLQCVAVCCSVLQCVAVCCSVLQCVAVCCSVLQCVAVPLPFPTGSPGRSQKSDVQFFPQPLTVTFPENNLFPGKYVISLKIKSQMYSYFPQSLHSLLGNKCVISRKVRFIVIFHSHYSHFFEKQLISRDICHFPESRI